MFEGVEERVERVSVSDVVVVGSSDCIVVDDERGEILVLVGGVGDSYTVR